MQIIAPRIVALSLALAWMTGLMPGLAHAAEAERSSTTNDSAEQAEALRMRRAVEQVKSETNGKILSVRSVKTGKVNFTE
ncbi:hypothetical protein HC761_00975 [bacterium]|nr:hypothetical protein [bacterium]